MHRIMGRSVFVLFVFLLGSFSPNSFSFELRGQAVGSKLPRLLYEVQHKLPPKLRQTIKSTIYVDFGPLDGSEAFAYIPGSSSSSKRSKLNRIVLSDKFIPALNGRSPVKGFDFSKARETLIHELAHIYDYRYEPDAARLLEINQCKKSKLERMSRRAQSHRARKTTLDDRSASLSTRCQLLLEQSTNVSEDPRFQYLGAWKGEQRLKNTRANRIVEHALLNTREYFAVHFALFIEDSNFQCRMPALNKYFVEKFGYDPYPSSDCELDTWVAIKNSSSYEDIDPTRLYEIHVLNAESGEAMASRFGHSLMRLVMCAPSRKEVGPDCLKDVRHHVVMAFNGNVTGLSTSVIRGITGYYESQLLFYRWTLVEKDYNKEQFRALNSIPLKATRDEMERIVYRALELHWTYGGDYKFFSNNCATELFDVLKSAMDNEVLWEDSIISPNGAVKVLSQAGLLDLNRKEVYNSYRPKLETAYQELVKAARETGVSSSLVLNGLDYHLNESFADERSDFFSKVVDHKKLKDPKKLVGAAYLLASYIKDSLERKMSQMTSNVLTMAQQGKLKIRKDSGLSAEEEEELLAQLHGFVQEVDQLLKLKESIVPSNRKISGYGVPIDEDYPESKEAQEDKVNEIAEKIKVLYKAREEFFQKYFDNTYQEIKGTRENMIVYLKKIREIGI